QFYITCISLLNGRMKERRGVDEPKSFYICYYHYFSMGIIIRWCSHKFARWIYAYPSRTHSFTDRLIRLFMLRIFKRCSFYNAKKKTYLLPFNPRLDWY